MSQANLNRIDQVTPQGTLTYDQIGTNADGTPKYRQTQTYSADEQKKYDLANQVAVQLSGLANDNIGRVADAQSKPFTYDGMTPLATSLNLSNGPGVTPLRTSLNLTNGPEGGVGIQNDLNYADLTKLPGTGDFSAEAQRTQNAVYEQAASRLNPQWQQNESDMKAALAAKGISENSDAYRREYDNMSRAKNDAYNQAQYSAINAGSQEQSRIFGLALGARQQGQNEVDTQGNFRNTAQEQSFAQRQAAAEMANKNEQANAAFYNTAQGQMFAQGQAAAAMGNQNSQASAQFQNSARQQEIEQAAYLRNIPLNDIAALLGTGGGVNDPSFSPVSQVGVAAPDYMGQVNNNYNAAMNQYNSQQQARSQMLGSIFGAAGSLGSAAIMMSDKRFKENVRRIGTLANGIATYTYNYIGDKAQQFGVMAQEVLGIRPEAVLQDSDGFMYVDYGKVY